MALQDLKNFFGSRFSLSDEDRFKAQIVRRGANISATVYLALSYKLVGPSVKMSVNADINARFRYYLRESRMLLLRGNGRIVDHQDMCFRMTGVCFLKLFGAELEP